jgi:hypothetical protein
MGNEQSHTQTVRVVKSARPWVGFFLGLLLGVSVAVILQQAGVWPLDKLNLFGAAGVLSLLGIMLASVGRDRGGALSGIIPLVLAVALLAWGATGLAEVNETGELNGGCTVEATSSVDSTVVTDTSRQDPFQIDPEGSLSWVAASPAPITNHFWEIYVDIGGFPVVIASNVEAEPNLDEDTENAGDVPNVSAYVADVSDYAGVELDGVFEVGGNIEGDGGACDGFGFVELTAGPFTTLISQIAAGVGLIALIGLLGLAFNRTREAAVVVDQGEVYPEAETEVVETETEVVEDQAPSLEPPPDVTAAAGAAGAATGVGAHERAAEEEALAEGDADDEQDGEGT